MTREEAYDAVAKLAAEHALILQGFGGVLTIVHPETQRREGVEEQCLFMAGLGPNPAARERQQEQQAAKRHVSTEEQLDIFNDSKEPAA
jgi:hypothetical protein